MPRSQGDDPLGPRLLAPSHFNAGQLPANRGYGVLRVNYRGSRGYGREFMMAGKEEYFGRMQEVTAGAAQWAVGEGVADPGCLAVLGSSFGGFSVMAQLIRKDQDWRCGVNELRVGSGHLEQPSVAVWSQPCRRIRADHAVGANLVLDDDGKLPLHA